MQKVAEYATHGAVFAVAANYLAPANEGITIGGKVMDFRMVSAVVGAATAAASDVVANFVVPAINGSSFGGNPDVQMVENGLLRPAINGAATYGVMQMSNALDSDFTGKEVFLIGVGSHIAADYIYKNFVAPMI